MKEASPEGRFWIKGDGCDIKEALQESVSGIWNGDVDLGDGVLEELRKEYEDRKNKYLLLGKQSNTVTRQNLVSGLEVIGDELDKDKKFLCSGLTNANMLYEKKYSAQNTGKKILMELCWETVEFSKLVQHNQALKSFFADLLSVLASSDFDFDMAQIIRNIMGKKPEMFEYLYSLFKKRRQPAATHVFVLLISNEQRNKKPYCMPVQYIPYYSLKDQTVASFCQAIRQKMVELGMTVVGTFGSVLCSVAVTVCYTSTVHNHIV